MKSIRSACVLLLFAAACTASDSGSGGSAADMAAEPTPPGTMDLVAQGLTFQGPTEIPSGWTTIRFRNEADVTHFAVVEKLPEGHDIADQQNNVAPMFQDGYNMLASGDVDGAMAKFGALPEWFGQIVFTGGPGLTAPGETSQATVYLEPGTYLFECYVKTGGVFHSYNPDPSAYGMVHQFTVTADASGAPEPQATTHIEISSTDGIQMDGAPAAGKHTFAVHFADQIAYPNFVGHDVHVVRLAPGQDMDALESWMDWTQPTGLQVPAPAHFLGGLQEMPAGATGYFTVTLEPGEYAFIAEVPGAAEKGMLRRFTVS